MKLHNVPRNTYIRFQGVRYFFSHIDGMYSYCIDEQANIIHLVAWAEVEIDNRQD